MSLFRLYKWKVSAIMVLVAFSLARTDLYAQSVAYEDDKIKSVFVYNLTHFVSWPEDTHSKSLDNFGICLLGEKLFENAIEKVVENETAQGIPIAIQRSNDLAEMDLDVCRILFIGEKLVDNLPNLIEPSQEKSILTMSDTAGFAENGGMINLIRDKRRIKIEINAEAVSKAGLKLNSKLLRLARVVGQASSPKD